MYYQNVRGLRTKTNTLLNATYSSTYDLIALSETWLDDSIYDAELINSECDRDFELTNTSRGGGVLLAIRKVYKVKQIDFNFTRILPTIDIVGVKVEVLRSVIFIIVLYIPPNLSAVLYESLFEQMFLLDYFNTDNVIILGDFNIPSYIHFINDNTYSNAYIVALNNLINFLNLISASDILLPVDSHHPPLELSFIIEAELGKFDFNEMPKYNYRRADMRILYNDIADLDFTPIYSVSNIDEACDQFYGILYSAINRSVPRTLPRNNRYPPWFSASIISKIKRKKKLWKKFRRTGDPRDYEEFSDLRRIIKVNTDAAYQSYTANVERRIATNPQRFWSFLDSRKNTSSIPNSMIYNNVQLNAPQDIVNAFAEFFQSTYILSTNITPALSLNNDFMPLNLPEQRFEIGPKNRDSYLEDMFALECRNPAITEISIQMENVSSKCAQSP
nr:unnamed protein product [Callosobruchus chinensis]